MGWRDVIDRIRQDEEEEKKRDQRGGAGDRVFGFLDDVLDTGERYFAPSADRVRARDIARELPGAFSRVGRGVGEFAEDTAQGMVRGTVGLGFSAADALTGRDRPEDEEVWKPTNTVLKGILGGEEDEKIETLQQKKKKYQRNLEEYGVEKDTASKLAVGGAAVVGALDAPTGFGSLVKQFGGQGVKQLAQEGTPEGIEQILKSRAPGMGDDLVRELAPKLAGITDEKVIRETLESVGKDAKAILNPTTLDAAKNLGNKKVQFPKKVESGLGDAADEVLGTMRSTSEVEDATKRGFREKAYEQFFDKLSPINRMVKRVEESTGRKLATEDNPYELMRLYEGLPAQIRQRVDGFTGILEQAPDLNAVKVIGHSRQVLNRANRGQQSNISAERAQQAIDQTKAKLGDDAFQQANAVVDSVVEYNAKLLDDLHDAGIISDDSLKAIRDVGADTDYFSRFNVVDHIMRNDQNRALFASGGSYNLARQNLVQAAKGMEKGAQVLDPIESVVRATDATMRAISKNNIWKSMNRLADEVPDIVKRVRDPENVEARIALSLDNKELRPVRNKIDRLMKTRGVWVRRLESEINKLEKQGLNVALKGGGAAPMPNFIPQALGGAESTTKAAGRTVDSIASAPADAVTKLGPQDTGRLVRSLVEGPLSEIQRLKKMVGTRDQRLAGVLDEITNLKAEFDDVAGTIKGQADQIRGMADEAVPEGYALISGFERGVGGKLAVPKEIADVYTGKTAAQQNYLNRMVGSVNNVMKQSVTSLNIPFTFVTNPIRDFKAMATNSEYLPKNPGRLAVAWMSGLKSAWQQDELYNRWIQSGGGGAGIYGRAEDAEQLSKDVMRKVNGRQINSAGDLMREAARFITAPARGYVNKMQEIGSVIEGAPRLAEFKAASAAGKSDATAALASRNVTVDFSQSGTVGQVMNTWIPFFNARLQGNKKILEGAKRDPARFGSVYATMTAAPIAATYAMNHLVYPEVMEQISQQDKDNNFLIVLGDSKDEQGNFKDVLRVPKGDVDKMFGNPLENFLAFMADNDPKSLAQVGMEMIGAMSPVDVVKDGKFNTSRAIGGVLPAIAKAPLEAATNRSLYFDNPLVPESLQDLPASEQVRQDDPNTPKKERETSGVAQFLAPLVGGGSPIVAENTIRGLTGNLLMKDPGSQLGEKVTGASASAPTNEFYSVINETKKSRASASKQINEAIANGDVAEARRIAQEHNAFVDAQFTPWAQRYGEYATPDLEDKYAAQKITVSKRSVKQRRRNQLEKAAIQ